MAGQLMTDDGNANQDWLKAREAIGAHARRSVPRYEKLWAYYRNPIELVRASGAAVGDGGSRGWYRSAQEVGLPSRIVGSGGAAVGGERGRREVVIENDIGWRIGAMVDFMFGSPIRIESLAEDEEKRKEIEDALEHVWETSGGIAMLQDMATLGHVFGHVDLLVRADEEGLVGSKPWDAGRWVSIEPIDARRGVAVLSAQDYREIDLYALHVGRVAADTGAAGPAQARRGWLDRLRGEINASRDRDPSEDAGASEVFTREGWLRVVDGEVVDRGAWALLGGVLPVVHVQNMSQPFVYEGIGEVEALVGLQDELNTRLSDRASRVTMQSFKMYLAKGIEGFRGSSVGPGMVWSTDNPEASISSFGGDASSPSEDAHIAEIREAMDKISGVPPLAGGVVRAKLGNLSSANALRITLMSLIAKTLRKRVSYGRGIERASELVLEYLNAAGVLRTDARDRGVRVVWGALPVIDEASLIAAGRSKVELGVDSERVIEELGYGDADPGVV
jgi:hypothetical protein